MSAVLLGVDPGLTGAIAVVDHDGRLLSVHDMPAVGRDISGVLAADLLDHIQARHTVEVAWVEKVGGMPGQGGHASFRFGLGIGIVLGVLADRRISVREVPPGTWKRAAGLTGKAKDASRQLALGLWPEHSQTFKRKKDEGRAEAALIARHGLHQAATTRAAS